MQRIRLFTWIRRATTGVALLTLVGVLVGSQTGLPTVAYGDPRGGSSTARVASTAEPAATALRPAPDPSDPVDPSGLSVPVDPIADRAAAAESPMTLVQALADRRAQALERGSAAQLDQADVAGSAAWTADRQVLDQLRAAGSSYSGLQFTVRSAVVVSGRSPPTGMTVRAVVDTAAYATTRAGVVTRHPALAGQPLELTLSWTPAGWRVAEIRAGR